MNYLSSDLDKGSNAAITYSITSGNGDGKFEINSNSGLITTKAPLDRETKDKYQLEVQAADGGTPQKSASVPVEITVGDLNDNSPEFNGAKNFQVTENAGRGTAVGQVKVQDKDIGEFLKVKKKRINLLFLMVLIIRLIRHPSYSFIMKLIKVKNNAGNI